VSDLIKIFLSPTSQQVLSHLLITMEFSFHGQGENMLEGFGQNFPLFPSQIRLGCYHMGIDCWWELTFMMFALCYHLSLK